MKIAAILPHLELYGGIRRYLEMGNEFVKRGYDYTILHPDGTSCSWMKFAGKIESIEEGVKDIYDFVVCGDTGKLHLLKEFPAKFKIMNLLGSYFAEKYRPFIKEDFIIVGNSSGWKDYLPGVDGYTIAGGVNTKIFKPVKVEKEQRKFCIVSYGRLRKKRKGTKLVLKILKKMRKKGINLVLFDTQEYKFSSKLQVKQFVNVPQEDMAEVYCQGDLFLSLEWGAGWSNTSAEAMACGVPVVCTTSGTKDFAIHEETALVLEKPIVIEAVKHIERLIEDEELRLKIAENGYKKIQEFSWERVCDKFEKLFKEVAK